MKHTLYTLLILFSFFALSSCSSGKENVLPGSSEGLHDLISRLRSKNAGHTYTLDPGILNHVTTAGGSVLTFPAHSFKNTDGTTVTDMVQLHIVELYSEGAIVLHHSSTMTDQNNILESGGQILLTAKDAGGRDLQATGYHISFNATYTDGYSGKSMGLFLGQEQAATGLVEWIDAPLVLDTVKASLDTMGTEAGFFYSFFDVDGLGWFNLDRFTDDGPGHNVSVGTTLDGVNQHNTIVYFVLEEMMSVGTLNGYNASEQTFVNSVYQLPAGYHVKFLVLSSIDGTIYYSLSDTHLLDADIDITLDMEAISESELSELISGL